MKRAFSPLSVLLLSLGVCTLVSAGSTFSCLAYGKVVAGLDGAAAKGLPGGDAVRARLVMAFVRLSLGYGRDC